MANLTKKGTTWVVGNDLDLASFDLDNTVDLTDGSWTHLDVANHLKSNSVSGEINTATLNAISAGTITQFSNAAYNGARWFKLLKDSSGVQVNAHEAFIFVATIQAHSSSNPAPFGFGIGTSTNPYATGSVGVLRQNFQHVSLVNENDSGVGRKHEYDRLLKVGGGGASSNHLTSSVVQFVQNFGSNRSGATVTSNIDTAATTAAGTSTSGTGSAVYVQIGLGTRYNTVAALEDAEHKATMKYSIIRLSNT